jgi:putative transposase
MTEIVAIIDCLRPYLGTTTLRQLSSIIAGMLSMTGRVTMLGLSRWTDSGGSYRTIQRWYQGTMRWEELLSRLYQADKDYLLVGDEVVVSKAGKTTYGLNRYFSSLAGRAMPGLSFLALSLVDISARQAHPSGQTGKRWTTS